MKKRDRLVLGRYIRACADALELRDWTVELGEPLPDDSCFAMVHARKGGRHALIRVCAGFRDLDPHEQRATIAHELIHCHFEPAWAMVRDDLDRHVGQSVGWVFFDAWRRSMEYGIEAMTQAVASQLPLIDWARR